MKVKNDNLPTEGVHIGKEHYLPGKEYPVDAELGEILTTRKGFTEITTKEVTTTENKGD